MVARIGVLIAVLTALTAGKACAEPPELARIHGLPAGETLTIRAEPRASANAVGRFADGDGPIEILETVRNGETEWARISHGEGRGWVARRFLQDVELQPIGETSLTVGLICSGTEPFWSIDLSEPGAAFWRDPETGTATRVTIQHGVGAAGRGGWPAALRLTGRSFEGVLVAAPTECSDGMSDRDYPWTALLVDQTEGRPRLFEGCCGHRPERRPR